MQGGRRPASAPTLGLAPTLSLILSPKPKPKPSPNQGAVNHSTATPLDCRGEVTPLTELMPTLGALPIYLFAFTNHQNAISATNEMDRHYSPFACRPPLGMLQPLSMRRG